MFPILVLLLVQVVPLHAQTIPQKLAAAFQRFEKDSQLQHALASLYITDQYGTVIFEKNADVGMAPASTQKIVTCAAAFALLGKDFRYETRFGTVTNSDGSNSLYIRGSGDPTLGSWRWTETKEAGLLNRVAAAAPHITFNNTVYLDQKGWTGETIPGGWIWDDIGNYYGAGAGVLNWRENQYDVFLKSGSTLGSEVVITATEPKLVDFELTSDVHAAAAGSGDNAYIYFPLTGNTGVVRGTIPINENRFLISGALPLPEKQLAHGLLKKLAAEKTEAFPTIQVDTLSQAVAIFHTERSPSLDSMAYWFLQKSINLYGEALLKTLAFKKNGVANTEAGIAVLKNFWQAQGISKTALNLVDGSGLSPLNRITTQAQVAVLRYARTQPWFGAFYNALPTYNGMKLKSGTINGVKGFAGYHTSRSGVTYSISFLVNNYNEASGTLVQKMYAVLDVLK